MREKKFLILAVTGFAVLLTGLLSTYFITRRDPQEDNIRSSITSDKPETTVPDYSLETSEPTTPTENLPTVPIHTDPTEQTEPGIKDVTDIVYIAKTVTMRVGPGDHYDEAGTVKQGTALQRTGVTDNGWSRVRCDGKNKFVPTDSLTKEKPQDVFQYPVQYKDDTAKITIYKEEYENTWCYAAHLKFSDYTRLKTECANGKYDNGNEVTSHAAERLNAIFAVNGDYSAPYLDYVVVRNGVICNGANRYLSVPGVYSQKNGLLLNTWESGGEIELVGRKVQELVEEEKVTDTFCFGYPFLANGEIKVRPGGNRAQRTFIGTNGKPGDLWVVVSDGRYNDGDSPGLTGKECAEYLLSKGCVFGIPLDGGGSSTMYFNGKVLNAASTSERAVVDFLVFSK